MSEQAAQILTHPVQTHFSNRQARVPVVVSLRAYEVYCHIFGPQKAMIDGACRGGFGIGELAAMLYARSFPEEEWSDRFDEACRGMENLA